MTDRPVPPVIDLVAGALAPEAGSTAPLYARLRDHVRRLILDERLGAGQRLPASRMLARDLGVSRTTVELAYDELAAEGFIERRRGSGTYVVDLLPRRPQSPSFPEAETPPALAPRLSAIGRRLGDVRRFRDAPGLPTGFVPCLPSEETFPIAVWNRVLTATLYDRGRGLQQPAPLLGDHALRTALADHLARVRRVRCSAERILIVASTQQALALLTRLLVDPGEAVWLEDPGYLGARSVFQAHGADVVPVPVDADGLVVEAGTEAAPEARLAYVTPSHQYPTGVTLSTERRVALLAWAAGADAWILEDDYDSEFRHVGRPLAPLQSLDREGRVIYVGSFNKVLFPGLRLAYVVLPESLVEVAERAAEAGGGQPSALVQATAATFLGQGHFASHLRRSRAVYRARREALLDTAGALGPAVRLGPSDTGLHVCARLPEAASDLDLSARASASGIYVPPLSPCYVGPEAAPGLILGYAGVDEAAIRSGIRDLGRLLQNET